jgi:hypothetical protein
MTSRVAEALHGNNARVGENSAFKQTAKFCLPALSPIRRNPSVGNWRIKNKAVTKKKNFPIS